MAKHQQLQGWCTDPFKLHDARYFSAGRPTKLVRDGYAESYDEPPSGAYEPDDAVELPQASGLAAADDGMSYPSRSPDRSRPGLLAGAAVLTVAAVVAGVLIANRSGSSPGRTPVMSPVAFVASSAGRTLAQRTADVTMTGTVGASGQSIAIQGTGEVNFSTNAMELDAGLNLSGHSMEEQEALVNGSLFYSITVDGKSLAQLIGRKWIQMPIQQSGSANLGANPASSLTVLAQHGNTVRKLGTKIVGGVNCTGYAVTPSKQAMLAAARKEIAALGLSPAASALEQSLVRDMSPFTYTVWVDGQGLVHEMTMNLQMNVVGSAASASVAMDFSHFGAPVRIAAPPPSDTMSYKSFMQKIGLGGLGHT